MSLYFTSPSSYVTIKKAGIFQLPSLPTIRRYLRTLEARDGFDDDVFQLLEAKLEKQADRFCTLAVDDISLKPGLTYDRFKDVVTGLDSDGKLVKFATVFMLQGITDKWKQPVGYFLTEKGLVSARKKLFFLETLEKKYIIFMIRPTY